MENEEGDPRWLLDFEAGVARNVRQLREARGISQQQLGHDLIVYGVGMHQTTVAKLEAGSKPLRLNEVAAIAAYFDVPVESLWEWSAKDVDELAAAGLLTMIAAVNEEQIRALAEVNAAMITLEEAMRALKAAEHEATKASSQRAAASMRLREVSERLADLEQRRDRIARGDE